MLARRGVLFVFSWNDGGVGTLMCTLSCSCGRNGGVEVYSLLSLRE